MLHSEFLAEWDRQTAAFKSPCGVPKNLDPVTAEYIRAFYMREELDPICRGIDRHQRFVDWAIQNYHTFARDIETARAKMDHELSLKVMTRDIPTRFTPMKYTDGQPAS